MEANSQKQQPNMNIGKAAEEDKADGNRRGASLVCWFTDSLPLFKVLDHYKYGYQVDSEDTGNFQQRYEARDGATVSGSYKVY